MLNGLINRDFIDCNRLTSHTISLIAALLWKFSKFKY